MDGIQGIIGRRGSEVRRAAATGECSTGGGGGRGVGAAALVTVGGAPPGGWLLGPNFLERVGPERADAVRPPLPL